MTRLALAAVMMACGLGCDPDAGPRQYQPDFKTSANFFTQMSQPVDNSGLDAGTHVHRLQRTWYSWNVKDRFTSASFEVPNGTVAITETYDAALVPTAHLVMVKRSTGRWYYEVRTPDGSRDDSRPRGDNASVCHDCHSRFAATDFLGAWNLRN